MKMTALLLLLFVAIVTTEPLLPTAASAMPPVELLGCFDASNRSREMLRANSSYHCKFGWRFFPDQANVPSAFTIELTGYKATELKVLYDVFKFKKVATDAQHAGTQVKMLQLGNSQPQNEPNSWFDVEFAYFDCVASGQPLLITVAPLGAKDWEPVIGELFQNVEHCRSTTSGKWFSFLQTSQASTNSPFVTEGTAAFIGIYLLLFFCCCCLGSICFNPFVA